MVRLPIISSFLVSALIRGRRLLERGTEFETVWCLQEGGVYLNLAFIGRSTVSEQNKLKENFKALK